MSAGAVTLALLRDPAPVGWAAAWALLVAGATLTLGALGAVPRRQTLVLLVALRLLALLTPPLLSDDLYRYVHEARATRLGLGTPYTTAPRDLLPPPPPDDGLSARVNHPEIPAAYPPASQLALWAVVGVGDVVGAPVLTWRAAMIALDLLVVALLFALPRRRSTRGAPVRPPRRWAFAWYGLHPLALLEACVGAHLDVIGMLLVLVALVVATRAWWAGLAVGLACGIKPIAVLALVGLPLRWRPLAMAGLGVTVGVLVPTAPYLLAAVPLGQGLTEYGTRWEAAPTGYAVVEAVVGAPLKRAQAEGRWTHLLVSGQGLSVVTGSQTRLSLGAPGPKPIDILLDQRLVARLAVVGLLALIVAWLLRRQDRLARATWALAALWWLFPTVHPWYLLWLLPLVGMIKSRALWCWAAAVPLTYEAALAYQQTGVWAEALWPRIVALLALLLGAALDLRPAWARRRARAARATP